MSRRSKKRKPRVRTNQELAAGGADGCRAAVETTSPEPTHHREPGPRRRRSRRALWIALALAALWGFVLLALVIFTANPVTLNRRQIEQADYVVTAVLSDLEAGQVAVEKEWKHDAALGTIALENLGETNVRPGRRYLIPVTKTRRGRYRVTETLLPGGSPLVYPATEDAASQLRQILDGRE